MRDIYQNAVLNIAATAAVDGNAGLFYNRNPGELEPFRIETARFANPETHNTNAEPLQSFFGFRLRYTTNVIDEAPLNRRAWVMQERHLSRRIIHYTSEELFWECQESFTSETHPYRLPMQRVDDPDWSPRGLKLLLDPYRKDRMITDKLYVAWNAFRYSYAQCQLTYEEDKLVAFAGIAQELSNILQDELVAGLWKSRFLRELCWSVTANRAARYSIRWIAPSWSWLSLVGTIRTSDLRYREIKDMAEVVNMEVQAKPSGALSSGHLILRCRPVPVEISNAELFSFTGDSHSQTSRPYFGSLILDLQEYTKSHREIFLVSLQEGYNSDSSQPSPDKVLGIILTSSARERGAFERIGMFDATYDFGDPHRSFRGDMAVRHRKAKAQTIKII